MRTPLTYLDYNATTPVKPAVLARVAEALVIGGNPSSVHQTGRLARAAVDQARDAVADLVNAEPDQIVFTSGATEANTLAIRSLAGSAARAQRGCAASRILLSALEHDSVVGAVHAADLPVEAVPVTAAGVIDLAALERMLGAGGPAIVALMLANNETGVIQPVAAAAEMVHAVGGWLHCDAVQGPGRIPVDFAGLGADTLTVSSHKMGGPQGVGALVVRHLSLLSPQFLGGGQERGMRAGTENVAGIAGFGVAARLAADDAASTNEIKVLRDDLEVRLQHIAPALEVFGAGAERLPNTSCFALAGIASETQVIALDLAGVAVSAGAACSSGKVGASPVLRAMGVADATAGSALRVSLGWNSRRDDVDRFLGAWSGLIDRRRRRDGLRPEHLQQPERQQEVAAGAA